MTTDRQRIDQLLEALATAWQRGYDSALCDVVAEDCTFNPYKELP